MESAKVSVKEFSLAMTIAADILDAALTHRLHPDFAMDRVIRGTIKEIAEEFRANAIPRPASK